MTSLLIHTVAHSTRPAQNQQPIPKKVFKSCNQLSKSCQKLQNSDFQSQFSMSKKIRIFQKKFLLKKMILGAHF